MPNKDRSKLGVDEDGDEFGTLAVRADPERGQQDVARDGAPKRVLVFHSACTKALGEQQLSVARVRASDPADSVGLDTNAVRSISPPQTKDKYYILVQLVDLPKERFDERHSLPPPPL
jgi:hypothetical protein